MDARDETNPYESPLESGAGAAAVDKDARTWAMLCHLSALAAYLAIPLAHVIGPLAVWLIKRDEHPFVDRHGKEAVNFQISMTIYIAIGIVLMFVIIGFVVVPVLMLLDLVFLILAAIKASNGEEYRYPMTIRFIQ